MELPNPLRGAIVAMNKDRVIGLDGALPWHYSADLKRFKRLTTGKTIVMGRLTWESIGSKPLPNRRNIVVSRKGVDGVECVENLRAVFDITERDDIWVIGGGQLYRAAFEYLNLLDITWVPDIVDDPSAVTFPEINPDHWVLAQESPLEEDYRLINAIYLRS